LLRRTALLLAVGKLRPCFLDGVLLCHERLRHVVKEAGRPLLKVLLDPGFGLRISRSRLRPLVQVLEQLIDGLLVLLVHLMPPNRSPAAQLDLRNRVGHLSLKTTKATGRPRQAADCTVDILPRLKAGDSSYYADWSSR
jgi:hypothetical protein